MPHPTRDPLEGLTPPHDLDAEGACLANILIRGAEALDELSELKAEHYYADKHARIHEAAIVLRDKGDPVDVVTVGSHLKNTNRIAQVGGMAYLTELLDAAPAQTGDRLRAYGQTVIDHALMRRLLDVVNLARAQLYNGIADTQAFLQHFESAVHDLTGRRVRKDLIPMREITPRTWKRMRAVYERPEGIAGHSTGLWELDDKVGGLHDSDLTVVAARPGMGKTSFVSKLATSLAKRDLWVAIFNLEMEDEQLAMRALCSEAAVDLRGARRTVWGDDEWGRLTDAAKRINALPIYIDDSADTSIAEIRGKVRRFQALADRSGKKIGAVMVDYIQLFDNPDEANREREIARVSRGLKKLAKEFKVPILALSQLNRAVESRTDKRPQLSDVRESGAIEQDADNIWFLYRDEYYHPETKDPGVAEIIVAKQRSGPLGTVKVGFDAFATSFRNLARPVDERPRAGDS